MLLSLTLLPTPDEITVTLSQVLAWWDAAALSFLSRQGQGRRSSTRPTCGL